MKIIAKDKEELWEYPILNRLAHLYRIQHAGKEGQLEEQEFLEETFFY